MTTPDITWAGLALLALISFVSATIGGISGFGAGLLITPFLLPIVGVKGVVPVITIAMILGNASRAWVYRRAVEPGFVLRLVAPIVPGVALGTFIYNAMRPEALTIAIGAFLVGSVGLRHALAGRRVRLSARGTAGVGFGFGVLSGSSPGAGIIMISILLGMGLETGALIGTDALIGLSVNLVKTALFGGLDLLEPPIPFVGLVVGAAMVPGAYGAKALVTRLGARLHAAAIEVFVIGSGIYFIVTAITAG